MSQIARIPRSPGDERLPQELIERVLDFAAVEDLKSCTLLCKALLPYSSSLYFRTLGRLSLRRTWAADGFLPALHASPRLTACVAGVTCLFLNPTALIETLESSVPEAFAALKELISATPRLQHLYLKQDADDMRIPLLGFHEVLPLSRGLKTLEMENTRLFVTDWALQMFPSIDELIIRNDPQFWEVLVFTGEPLRTRYSPCTRLHRVKRVEMHWSYGMPATMSTLPHILDPDVLETIVLKASGREASGERYMCVHLEHLLAPFAPTLRELEVYDVGYVINPSTFRFAPPDFGESVWLECETGYSYTT